MSRPRLSAPPPPPKDDKPAGRLAHAVPARGEAPQNMTTSNQKRWVDLSFKLTEDERDEFILEAAKRKMKHKELFQAAMQHYRDTYPVPDR
uniref:hypothetical protein n=1 Tax=Methylobacterium sp. B34 TaxID=95563 RepID=UPI0005B25338|nr:hypothetical protein [Methylobacterium sp. B34]